MGYAKLLQRSLAMEGTDRTYLQEIMVEVGALEATLTALLAFAKPLQLAPVAVDLKALTLETLEGFRQAAEEGQVELRTDLPAEEVTLQADPYALRQALGNLIRNALEAMPQGGELAVAVRPSGGALGEQTRAVELSVQDTGPGIPPEDLDRLFAPFFTRKEGGTGLGLALVQKTVVAHGGRVSAENRDGGGACFTIRLPLHERRRVGRG
jgi:signal transduction histidine kinase